MPICGANLLRGMPSAFIIEPCAAKVGAVQRTEVGGCHCAEQVGVTVAGCHWTVRAPAVGV